MASQLKGKNEEIKKLDANVIFLNVQVSEAKRMKELMGSQLTKKEEYCDNLKEEIVYLRNRLIS